MTIWGLMQHAVCLSKMAACLTHTYGIENKLDRFTHRPCGESMLAADTYDVDVGAACTCTPPTRAEEAWLLLTAHIPRCSATNAAEHAVSTLRAGPV